MAASCGCAAVTETPQRPGTGVTLVVAVGVLFDPRRTRPGPVRGVCGRYRAVTGTRASGGVDRLRLPTGELGAVEVGVAAAEGQQLLVRARLHDPAAVDDEDAVGVADGRQPVRDHQR